MIFDALWALGLLGLSLSGQGWLSSRFALSSFGTLASSLLGIFGSNWRGSKTLGVSEIVMSAATGYFAPQVRPSHFAPNLLRLLLRSSEF